MVKKLEEGQIPELWQLAATCPHCKTSFTYERKDEDDRGAINGVLCPNCNDENKFAITSRNY